MATPEEFANWIRSLPTTRVRLHNDEGTPLHSIDLATLAKDVLQHPDLQAWWRSKNMPRHLNNTVAKTILALGPPEGIKAAMLFMIL